MRKSEDFQLVTRRRRSGGKIRNNKPTDCVNSTNIESDITAEQLLRRVQDAVPVLEDSSYRQVLDNGLTECLSILDVDSIPNIVCYGLGNFSLNRSSKYQLAVLLALKSHYHSQVCLYDPIFYPVEIAVLKSLGLTIIEVNEEAKRKGAGNLTLFYMPHCYKGLVANCIWANWTVDLRKCIFLTNSFTEMADDCLGEREDLKASVELIQRINSYTKEITIESKFNEAAEAFSSTALHIFPREKLNCVPENFWTLSKKPPFTFNPVSELKKD